MPTYAELVYRRLYPGIDLHYTGRAGQLKASYVLAPGALPEAIYWRYTGARSLRIDPTTGDLHVSLPGNAALVETAPVAWQVIDGRKRPVLARYTLSSGRIGFSLGPYEPAYPLVIDPLLSFSGYFGGSGDDEATDIARDYNGNILIIGSTKSTNFPTVLPVQSNLAGNQDAFIMKLSPDGSQILFATYMGGSAMDQGAAIVTDSNADGSNEIKDGSIWIAGRAPSLDFPTTTGAYQEEKIDSNGFLAKLTQDGIPVYSTYVGGQGAVVTDVAVDPAGTAYVTGTVMTGYPIVNGFDTTIAGLNEGFMARFNAAGDAILYATYLGGDATEIPSALLLSGDRVYVAGYTASTTNFPTTPNAYQPLHAGGNQDAFITGLTPTLSGSASLAISTLLGGGVDDRAYAMDANGSGDICITGNTSSTNYPLVNAYQTTRRGASDAYLTCLTHDLSGLTFSTLLGGRAFDVANDLYIHPSGTLCLTGYTLSDDFPIVFPTYGYHPGKEAFITVFAPGGSGLMYSTYLGGNLDDEGQAILGDADGNILVAGATDSTNFPVVTSDRNYAGSVEAFVSIFNNLEPQRFFLPLVMR